MRIRAASINDCAAILGLIRELAEYEKAPQEVTNTVENLESTGFGPNPIWWGYVAEIDDQIVGFALYYIRYSTWKGPRMYLEDLYIKPEFRRFGIGKAFMEVLEEDAKKKGLNGMVWQVLDWNEPAIAFYKKLGASFDGEWINCTVNLNE